jgi:hypothetical protein
VCRQLLLLKQQHLLEQELMLQLETRSQQQQPTA